uniref:Transposase n=1 Tax=Haemonchus placei TaxID=6290 RepID=A0A0N4WKC8_HAEPC
LVRVVYLQRAMHSRWNRLYSESYYALIVFGSIHQKLLDVIKQSAIINTSRLR